MQAKSFRLRTIAAALLASSVAGTTLIAQPVGKYDFAYQATGEPKVRPVQVFDDGAQTYFQFRPGEPIPAIFANDNGEETFLIPEVIGPYVRVKTVSAGYTLKMVRSVGQVQYQGARATLAQASAAMQVPAMAQAGHPGAFDAQGSRAGDTGTVRPVSPTIADGLRKIAYVDPTQPRIAVDINSYARPIKGDVAQFQPDGVSPTVTTGIAPNQAPSQVEQIPFVVGATRPGPQASSMLKTLAKKFADAARIEVIGRYDNTYKIGVAESRAASVVEALAAYGVPKVNIGFKTTEAILPERAKNVSTGVTIQIYSRAQQPHEEYLDTPVVSSGKAAQLGSLVTKLKSGQISPSQASAMIRAANVAGGVHGTVQPVAGFQEAQITRWLMNKSDASIQGVLTRWAGDAGWHLIWRNAPLIKVNGDAELIRDGFVSAADYVLAQAQVYGYKIKARAYNNKVLVVSAE